MWHYGRQTWNSVVLISTILAATILLLTPGPAELLQGDAVAKAAFQRSLTGMRASSWNLRSAPVPGIEVKLLCFVVTCPTNLDTKAIYVKKTWGSRCDKTIYISDAQNDTFPTIKVSEPPEGNPHNFLWRKTRNTLELLYKEYMDEFDWFMKADDDTYVIVENLRRFLRDKDPETDMEFYGKAFKLSGKVYNSGGGGYVFGKGALRRVVEGPFRNSSLGRCPEAESGGSEDVYMGWCFNLAGVNASQNSVDEEGRELFNSLSMAHELIPSFPSWYVKMSIHPLVPHHSRCCSPYVISFHYVRWHEMIEMHHLLYNVSSHISTLR